MRAGVAAGGGAALPGMLFNAKKPVTYTDAITGKDCSVPAGRLECTMQVPACLAAMSLPAARYVYGRSLPFSCMLCIGHTSQREAMNVVFLPSVQLISVWV